jgi:hypothetical protein
MTHQVFNAYARTATAADPPALAAKLGELVF